MPTHRIATREQWRAERLELLEAEKDLTRRSDELARRRQQLPWVKIEKPYRFDTDDGSATLADLFTAARLSFHVRPRLRRGLSVVLGDRRRLQRFLRPLGEPRRDALGRLPCAARQAPGLQAAHGLDVPLGVGFRQRFQLGFQARMA